MESTHKYYFEPRKDSILKFEHNCFRFDHYASNYEILFFSTHSHHIELDPIPMGINTLYQGMTLH